MRNDVQFFEEQDWFLLEGGEDQSHVMEMEGDDLIALSISLLFFLVLLFTISSSTSHRTYLSWKFTYR